MFDVRFVIGGNKGGCMICNGGVTEGHVVHMRIGMMAIRLCDEHLELWSKEIVEAYTQFGDKLVRDWVATQGEKEG